MTTTPVIPPFEYLTQPSTKVALPDYINFHNTQFKKLTQTIRQIRAGATVSVQQFGAIGDGVTDDTGAIQTALNSGAGTIYVPPGTYAIKTSLTIPSNTTMAGAGMFVSILKSTATTSPGQILANSSFTVGNVNIEIRDLGFDGNNASGPSGNVTPPTLAAHGIRFTFLTRGRIWRCWFKDQPMENIAIYGNNATAGINVDIEVADCILSGAGDSAIDVSDLNYSQLHRNRIVGFYNTAVNLQPLAQGNPGVVQSVSVQNNMISNPFTRWTTPGFGYGVIIQAWSNPTFQGIANTVSISDNVIYNVVEAIGAGGIHIADTRITGNVIGQCTQRGIYLYFTPNAGSNPLTNISIIDNEILNCSTGSTGVYSAIELNDTQFCVVQGNTMIDNQGTPTTASGIHETGGSTNNLIGENYFHGVPGYVYGGSAGTRTSLGPYENWGKISARASNTVGPTPRYRTTIENDGTKGYLSAQDDVGPGYMPLALQQQATMDAIGNFYTPGLSYKQTTVTANYSASVSDTTIFADTTSNTVAILLPAASGVANKIYNIKWIKGANACTITRTGSDSIEGTAGTFTVTPVKTAVSPQSDGGTNWWFI